MTDNSDRGWNASTMCLQVLHDYEFPKSDCELPQRPPDLGVGLWR